jgi:hypothetical protein
MLTYKNFVKSDIGAAVPAQTPAKFAGISMITRLCAL